MSTLTREDLIDLRNMLSTRLDTGFSDLNERLDVLNGRVGRGEVDLGKHDIRLTNVEREVFRASTRRPDPPDEDRRAPPEEDRLAITRRDVNVAIATVCGAGGVVTFLWKILPAVIRFLTHP